MYKLHSRRYFKIKPPFNKAIRLLLMADSMWLMGRAMLGPIYALFVAEIGGSLFDAGITFGVYALSAGIITLVSGTLVDRVKENELIIAAGFLISGIGFGLYTMVDSMTMLLIAQAVIGAGEATKFPAYDEVYSKHLDKNKGGEEWGAWESVAYFTTALGAVAGGYVASKYGFDAIFGLMTILSLSAAIFIYVLPRKAL